MTLCSRSTIRHPFLIALLLNTFFWSAPPTSIFAQALPTLPQVLLDTTYAPPTGNRITVNAGGDLQAALNAAQLGDTIVLQAGAQFSGPFTLPNKTSGSGWIYVESSRYSSLPAPGSRVSATNAANMPKVVVSSGGGSAAIQTAAGAHHFRFVGIEVTPVAGNFVYNLVQLGAGETTLSALPHDIVFDRCYLHGDSAQGTRRGIAMNAARVAVIDSYLADFKEVDNDSQALASWNGVGPFKIVNNYLEGAATNILFGGADPSILNLVPSDIEIRRNLVFKPLSWRIGDPSYAGTHWSVKNLLELKNAQRVLIEGNIFENNWGDGQAGFAILFTVRNQDGKAPWSVVQDVSFQRNIVRHTGSGMNILGFDSTWPNGSQQTKRILIKDNIFVDVNGTIWSGDGRLLQSLQGVADVTIDHNTGFQTGPIIMAEGTPATGFVYRNNITPYGSYGVIGTNTSCNTLTTYFPGSAFVKNILAAGGASSACFPSENFFPATLNAVGFANLASGDFHLAASSIYKNAATDGKDVGADVDAVNAATARVIQGTPGAVSAAPSAPTTLSIR